MYCKKCGKQIPDDSKFCPECGGQISDRPAPLLQVDPNMQKKKKSGCGACGLIVLGVLIAFVALILLPVIFYSGDSEASQTESTHTTIAPTTTATEPPVIDISPSDLHAAYEENEVAADNQYKNQKVRITGIIDTIGKDVLDDVYVTIETDEMFAHIQCYFSDDAEIEKVATLKSGDEITIVGICKGLSITQVVLHDSEIE